MARRMPIRAGAASSDDKASKHLSGSPIVKPHSEPLAVEDDSRPVHNTTRGTHAEAFVRDVAILNRVAHR